MLRKRTYKKICPCELDVNSDYSISSEKKYTINLLRPQNPAHDITLGQVRLCVAIKKTKDP